MRVKELLMIYVPREEEKITIKVFNEEIKLVKEVKSTRDDLLTNKSFRRIRNLELYGYYSESSTIFGWLSKEMEELWKEEGEI